MKPTESPSPREELPEPLRSVVDDIVGTPIPEELLHSARRLAMPKPGLPKPGRSALVLVVSVLALGLCIAALLVRQQSSNPPERIAEQKLTDPKAPMDTQTEQIPPPTFWAYRQAHSAEALDELLSDHAAVLLPATPRNEFPLFPSHIRKEEL